MRINVQPRISIEGLEQTFGKNLARKNRHDETVNNNAEEQALKLPNDLNMKRR